MVVARPGDGANLDNIPAGNIIAPDQYFTFVWEDMNMDKIEFNLDAGKIGSSTPVVIANQTLKNGTDVSQEMSGSYRESVEHSSTFQFRTGFTVTTETEFNGAFYCLLTCLLAANTLEF